MVKPNPHENQTGKDFSSYQGDGAETENNTEVSFEKWRDNFLEERRQIVKLIKNVNGESSKNELKKRIEEFSENVNEASATFHKINFKNFFVLVKVLKKAFKNKLKEKARVSEESGKDYHKELTKEEAFSKLQDELLKSIKKSQYLVDGHHDDIWESYESLHEKYLKFVEKYNESKPEFEKQLRIEFYKIYRRKMLSEFEIIEREETSSPDWKGVFLNRILSGAHNLVELITEVTIQSYEEFEKNLKKPPKERVPELVDLSMADEIDNKILEDFINLRNEYTARKFLHISWMENRVGVVGIGEGSRHYPNINRDGNWPLGYVLNYTMKDGLKPRDVDGKEIFNDNTNPVLQEKRISHPLGFSTDDNGNLIPSRASNLADYDPNNRGTTVHDVTLFEEVSQTMDDWVAGSLSDHIGVTTANFHTDLSGLVSDLTSYLKKKYPDKKDLIQEVSVRRAARSFLLTPFHASARAHHSAILGDYMYYQSHWAEHSVGYGLAGTADWNPNFSKALFGFQAEYNQKSTDKEPITDAGFKNTIPIMLGQHPNLKKERNAFWRMIEGDNPYTDMMRALKRGGFLVEDSDLEHPDGTPKSFAEFPEAVRKRLETDNFVSYNFLGRPLIGMADTTQAPRNRDVLLSHPGSDGLYYKRSSDGLEDRREAFSQMPPLATVPLKDNDGRVIRYVQDGEPGRAVTLFDLRDEHDRIMYGLIDWDRYAVPLSSVVGSLHKNGLNFLNNFLKTKDALKALEDPAVVSKLKNDAKYLGQHLPDQGRIIAARLHETPEVKAAGYDHPYYKIDKGFINTIIAQMIFHGCLARLTDDENPWTLEDVNDYLIKLLRPESSTISIETKEAIYTALSAAMKKRVATKKYAREMRRRFKDVYKRE